MAERRREAHRPAPALEVRGLHVYHGSSHALQGVDLELDDGVHAVLGRNGMGKTTLCNAIMGLVPVRRGTVRVRGEDVTGRAPHAIARLGVGYCPQGRRLWPSLTVDEHLRLADAGGGSWTVERIYETFPRLVERRGNGGAQLSGGEQQMLAISRALLGNPSLLVFDEPTEGLAPVIVGQVERLMATLADEGEMAILLVEQNIAVATAVADDIAIVVNGRIDQVMTASALAGDRALQERLLGVGRHAGDGAVTPDAGASGATGRASGLGRTAPSPDGRSDSGTRVGAGTGSSSGRRADAARTAAPGVARAPRPAGTRARDTRPRPEAPAAAPTSPPSRGVLAEGYRPPERWSRERWGGGTVDTAERFGRARSRALLSAGVAPPTAPDAARTRTPSAQVLVAGTFDTKGPELRYCVERLAAAGLEVRSVDLSTSGRPSSADVPPAVVAAAHPDGRGAVFTRDRGSSVSAMAVAFERWLLAQPPIGGVLAAGGSGGTALATPAMRALPIGVPKVMVSSVASGDVGGYVGASDLLMMYSITDVQGLNRISREVLGNAAAALAGMVRSRAAPARAGSPGRTAANAGTASGAASGAASGGAAATGERPTLGLTMFGVTTTAVQQLSARLEDRYECLVFHATGTGGRSLEKLVDDGLLDAAIDLTTTEVCDLLFGGVFAASADRFGAFIRTGLPWVGSVGALDMVNFGARDTVPARYASRRLVEHNAQVTLMRTTPEENREAGVWIAERLNAMPGAVRLLLPEGGVSALDAPGEAFHDPGADAALFEALERTFRGGPGHRLERVPCHINDAAFADAVRDALLETTRPGERRHHGTH